MLGHDNKKMVPRPLVLRDLPPSGLFRASIANLAYRYRSDHFVLFSLDGSPRC